MKPGPRRKVAAVAGVAVASEDQAAAVVVALAVGAAVAAGPSGDIKQARPKDQFENITGRVVQPCRFFYGKIDNAWLPWTDLPSRGYFCSREA
jgi:hypothetical protein